MVLKIETFSNHTGGNALYKALSHPKTFQKMTTLLQQIGQESIALYDPLGILDAVLEFYALSFQPLHISSVYAQDFKEIGKKFPAIKDITSQPLTELAKSSAQILLILAFGKDNFLSAISPYLAKEMKIYSLDDVRLDALAEANNYLTPLNFATNFAFFREQDGFHTSLITANYWHRYGAKDVYFVCTLLEKMEKFWLNGITTLKAVTIPFVLTVKRLKSDLTYPPSQDNCSSMLLARAVMMS